MALSDTASGAIAKSTPEYRFSPFWMVVAAVSLSAIIFGYNAYQHAFGLSMGIDATSAEFDAYWWTLLIVQVPVIITACLICWGYLIATRVKDMASMTPATELKNLFYMAFWLLAYTIAVFPVGFMTEADASWHQTVMRDTAFGPTHITLFYGIIPIYLFFGIGSFIYAMTRCPVFARGISFMHVLAVIGPFLILANVGFNEWGHAFWLTEEIFSHPLHWGFVVLGVTGLALTGVAAQMTMRFSELFPQVFKGADA